MSTVAENICEANACASWMHRFVVLFFTFFEKVLANNQSVRTVLIMTAIQAEERDNEMLRKAKESLEYAREKEREARRALRAAEETRKTLKAKYERLFRECDQKAYQRRKEGLIAINHGY